MDDSHARELALSEVFGVMRTGLSYPRLLDLCRSYARPAFSHDPSPWVQAGFHQYLDSVEASFVCSLLQPQHEAILVNYIEYLAGDDWDRAEMLAKRLSNPASLVRYPPGLLDAVLGCALASSVGEYILRRLVFVLACEDVAAKLQEIVYHESPSPTEPPPTSKLVTVMCARGLSPEQIATQLNASPHTEWLDDMRVARKATSVYLDMGDETALGAHRLKARRKIGQCVAERILPRWRRCMSFAVGDLTDLLEANLYPSVSRLLAGYRRRDFDIKILDGANFDAQVRDFMQGYVTALFIARPHPLNSLLLIRDIDAGDMSHEEGQSLALSQVLRRIAPLIHEWEHWSHFRGSFEGVEAGGERYSFSLDRPNRMGSEVLAFLEEWRWTRLHLDDELWQNLAFLGDLPSVYFRTLAELTYYSVANERLSRLVIP